MNMHNMDARLSAMSEHVGAQSVPSTARVTTATDLINDVAT